MIRRILEAIDEVELDIAPGFKKPAGKWTEEFGPEFDVPKEILAHPRMEDMSWHNDASPSFGASKGEPGDLSDPYVEVRLWVDHPDPDKREYPGSKRFSVFVQSESQEVGDPSGLFDQGTDDLDEAIRWWDEQAAKHLGW